jgi:stearoyl-CoA desaturase (delta-9 desaturase)
MWRHGIPVLERISAKTDRYVYTPLLLARILIFPLLAALAVYLLISGQASTRDLLIFIGTYYVHCFGITVGLHRMLTHEAFSAAGGVRFGLLALGSMAFMGPVSLWATDHLKHHATSDRDDDPHSPTKGFFHAHMGWIFKYDRGPAREQFGWRFRDDLMVQFFDQTAVFWVGFGALIAFLLGGWTGLLWGFAVRVFACDHTTWLVNSWCHTFGSQDYETKDNSRNALWLAPFTVGESFHNNHHAFPQSAYHGFRWYQVDLSGYLISVLEALGLVKDVHKVGLDQRLKRAKVAAT